MLQDWGGAELFGFLQKKPTSGLQVLGHKVEVASIIRDGRVLFTSDVVKAFPQSHFEGSVFEVQLSTRSGNPYFAYYLCPTYYFAVAGPAGAASFGGPQKTNQFRSAVSQQIAVFVVEYLRQVHQIDARADIISFSHNVAHTNVMAHVNSLKDWFPIQHSDAEGDDASEQKVAAVNRGTGKIADFIAVASPSPHA